MQTPLLPRLGISDFLGTLPAGFYVIGFLWYSFGPSELDKLLLHSAVSNGEGQVRLASWVLPAIVGISFLIGSVFRAFPVFWLEWLPGEKFPFPSHLNDCIKLLGGNENDKVPEQPTPEGLNIAMMWFDYWKNVLCRESPNAYVHIKTLESKVRFLVGMVWANLCGITIALSQAGFGIGRFNRQTSLWFFAISILALAPLMFALLRARKEEASEVVWAYCAYLKSINGIKFTAGITMPSTTLEDEDTTLDGHEGTDQ